MNTINTSVRTVLIAQYHDLLKFLQFMVVSVIAMVVFVLASREVKSAWPVSDHMTSVACAPMVRALASWEARK